MLESSDFLSQGLLGLGFPEAAGLAGLLWNLQTGPEATNTNQAIQESKSLKGSGNPRGLQALRAPGRSCLLASSALLGRGPRDSSLGFRE